MNGRKPVNQIRQILSDTQKRLETIQSLLRQAEIENARTQKTVSEYAQKERELALVVNSLEKLL